MAKYGKKSQDKVERAMHEMKEGKLKSGRSGRKVTNPKQAIAIGLSEAREEGGKVPKKAAASRKSTTKSGEKKTTRKAASKPGPKKTTRKAASKPGPKKTTRKAATKSSAKSSTKKKSSAKKATRKKAAAAS